MANSQAPGSCRIVQGGKELSGEWDNLAGTIQFNHKSTRINTNEDIFDASVGFSLLSET
jgi:hypothetical protein